MKKSTQVFSSILLLILLGTLPVKADPINSINGFAPAKGQFLFVTQYRSARASNSTFDFRQGYVPMVFAYSPTEKLTTFAILPWLTHELRYKPDIPAAFAPFIPLQRDGSGLGDITLYSAYRFFTKNTKGASHRLTLFNGLQVPTGRNMVRDKVGVLPASLQPGTGTWDPIVALGYRFDTVDYKADANFSFKYNTTDSTGFSMGNEFAYNFSLERRILPWKLPEFGSDTTLSALLEFNGLWTMQSEFNGINNKGSDNHVLFISPGLQLAHKNMIFDLSLMLPVIKNFSAGAIEPDINLVGGVRLYL